MIYLDNSATTLPAPEVVREVVECMTHYPGNPSSRHSLGAEAAKRLENCRERLAKVMGVKSGEVYFTSGGTESDNIAVLGGANIKKGKRIVTTAVEHPAVLECMKRLEERGFEVVRLAPGRDGSVPTEAFREALTPDTCLVSVMTVNNETGAIMPVDRLAPIIKAVAPRALFHTDAVQAFGHIPLPLARWGVDLASVSGHKIHGPRGVGALYVRSGVTLKTPVLGGGQEKGLRSGTENLPAIAGFALAAELAASGGEHVPALKAKLLEEILKIPGAVRNGGDNSSPYILNVSFEGIRSEVMLNALSAAGICVSAGSACASAKAGGSYVLKAMGAMADNAVRFSLSRHTAEAEILAAAAAVREAAEKWRR